jgi:hypothetical protein
MTKTQAPTSLNKNKNKNPEAPRQKIVSSKGSKEGKRKTADYELCEEEIK